MHAKNTSAKSQSNAIHQTHFSAWLICALGAFFYGYEYFLRVSPSVMIGQLMHYFDVDAASLGNLSAYYYYAYVPLQLLVGVLMDRYGPRRLLTMACFACAAGSYVFASSRSLVLAEVGRFLVGFGSAFAFVGVLKLATIWLPPERFALMSGFASAIGTVGAIAGDIFLTHMVHGLGWHSTINLSALIAVVLAAAIFFIVRDSGKYAIQPYKPQKANFKTVLTDLWGILKDKRIWINGLFGCLVYVPTTGFAELWGPRYLQVAQGFSSDSAAWANSIIFLSWGISAPIMGWLSDRIKRRVLPMKIGAAFALLWFSLLLYLPQITQTSVIILLALGGMSYAVQVLVFAYACEITPTRAAGTAIAVTNMLVMLGGMVFQPLIGWVIDLCHRTFGQGDMAHIGITEFRYALTIIPLSLLLAVILPLFLKETECTS